MQGSRFRWFVLLGALVCGVLGTAVAAAADYPFRLTTHAAGSEFQVTAENDGPAPVTVQITVSGNNFASDRAWPLVVVVAPHTALPLGRMYAKAPSAQGYSFLCNYIFHLGRVDAVPTAGADYRLPFEDGRGYLVSQAYGGKLTTHENQENQHAVDFAMPSGSAVTAARAGVVTEVTLHHRAGGDDIRYRDMANKVVIVHDDGTTGEYAHLSPGAEIVNVGQRVEAGDLLGYSGSTGYASGPHLHFVVSRPAMRDGQLSRVSIPVLFYTNEPARRFSVQEGTAVWASYRRTVTAGNK